MRAKWIVLVGMMAILGCSAHWRAAFKDGWTLSAMKPEAYQIAKAKMDALVVGKSAESEFRVIWYGATPEETRKVYDYVNAGLIIGPEDAPRTLDTQGCHSAVHHIIRKEKGKDYPLTESLWDVTFVNGVLESVYTY